MVGKVALEFDPKISHLAVTGIARIAITNIDQVIKLFAQFLDLFDIRDLAAREVREYFRAGRHALDKAVDHDELALRPVKLFFRIGKRIGYTIEAILERNSTIESGLDILRRRPKCFRRTGRLCPDARVEDIIRQRIEALEYAAARPLRMPRAE